MPESDKKEIFPDAELSALAIQWKELNRTGKHAEAMEVLEKIIVGSTDMFQRLAQHEKFHYTVELPVLVAAAQLKVVRWLLAWKPEEGYLFSWFSKCAKNAYKSEAVRVSQYRKRFHVTSDSLEKFFGETDHEIHRHDAEADTKAKLAQLTCRWGSPQEIGALRFIIECIVSDRHDRQRTINGAAFCYGLSLDMAKFFYSWALIALREAFHERIRVPHTSQDQFRAEYSYTFLVDLLDIIGWEKMLEVCAKGGGCRFKLPTLTQLSRLAEDCKIFQEVDVSDSDPHTIDKIGKKYGRGKTAAEVYDRMAATLDPTRSGEYEIFGGDEY